MVGSRLDDKVRAHGRGVPGVRMVGWVPSIEPYLGRARVCVAPLLHGAGIKGKVVEAMLRGTPVVTTPIGAEGLDLTDGEHAMIAERPAELATGDRRAALLARALATPVRLGVRARPRPACPGAGGRSVPRDRRGGARGGAPGRRRRQVAAADRAQGARLPHDRRLREGNARGDDRARHHRARRLSRRRRAGGAGGQERSALPARCGREMGGAPSERQRGSHPPARGSARAGRSLPRVSRQRVLVA